MEHSRTLPPPAACDNCCSANVKFCENSTIYGVNHGEWPYIYFCEDCRASVGCHKGTRRPLGRMADKQTRQLRMFAHKAFDPIWRQGFMTRTEAYNWLAEQLQIEPQDCHISWFNKEQLNRVLHFSRIYMANASVAQLRRKEKKDERDKRDRKRHLELIERKRKAKEPKFPRGGRRSQP